MISQNLENIVLEPKQQPTNKKGWVTPLLIGIGVLSAAASISYLTPQHEKQQATEIYLHTPCINNHEQYAEVKPCYQEPKKKLLLSYE